MLINFNEYSQDKIQASICIIGGGPAAITAGKLLAEKGIDVVALESGDTNYTVEAQNLNAGVTEGSFLKKPNPDYLSKARLRYLGGTANHWEGWTRPFDSIDFQTREWISESGWPIEYDEFRKYFDKAASDLGFSDFQNLDKRKIGKDILIKDSKFETVNFQMIPIRFQEFYKDFITVNSNFKIYYNATTTEIIPDITGKTIQSVIVKNLKGKTVNVYAEKFILAAGGIENPRILLCSRSIHKNGIGNDKDLVGRYFADHPHMSAGLIIVYPGNKISKELYSITALTSKDHEVLGVIGILDKTINKHKLLNASIEIKQSSWQKLPSEVQGQMLAFAKIDKIRKRINNVDNISKFSVYRAYLRAEQTPNRESRVTLLDEKDALGMQKVKLDWRINNIDAESYRKALKLFGNEIAQAGFGRFWINYDGLWPKDSRGGYHHMGTTRMSNDPNKGVVDSNCKVHGIDNLFIAGSSVFPTYSAWNPTVNFLALVYRLIESF